MLQWTVPGKLQPWRPCVGMECTHRIHKVLQDCTSKDLPGHPTSCKRSTLCTLGGVRVLRKGNHRGTLTERTVGLVMLSPSWEMLPLAYQ